MTDLIAATLIGRLLLARKAEVAAEAELADYVMSTGEPAESPEDGLSFDFDGSGNLVSIPLFPRSPSWSWPSPSPRPSGCSASAAGRSWRSGPAILPASWPFAPSLAPGCTGTSGNVTDD